jgi:hypothetical protein
MTRQVQLGYGRLAAGILAVVATTWGVGAAVAAPGNAATVERATGAWASAGSPTAASTGTITPRTTAPSPSDSSPGGSPSDSSPGGTTTPCPYPTWGTGGTAPPAPSDFEDGGVGNWTGDTGVTLTNTDELAASGHRSLRAAGVTGTSGATLTQSHTPAQGSYWHRVTAKVRLAPGGKPAYVKLAPISGYTKVPGVARVTADAWTTITAWFTPSTLYWDAFCNGQMYGGSLPILASLNVLLSGDACADATAGPVTLFIDDVTYQMVTTSTVGTTPPEPASTPQCGSGSTSPPAPVCTARYDTLNNWGTGYLGQLRVVNHSTTTLSRWVLTWRFPGNQRVTSLWGADGYQQKGSQVTATGPAWSVVPPGRALEVGFVATGTAGTPQSITIDGHACSVSTTG